MLGQMVWPTCFSRCFVHICPMLLCQASLSGLFTELVCPDCSTACMSTMLAQLWFAQLATPTLFAQLFVTASLCRFVAQPPSPACM